MDRIKLCQQAKRRVRSSSLIEVITAMIIISMITTIAMMIYLNVQQSGFSLARFAHRTELEQAYQNLVKNKDYSSKEIDAGSFQIVQTVNASPLGNGLLYVVLESKDTTGKIVERSKHLLYDPAATK